MAKLLLSRMLPLKIFGYYALASSVASVLFALGMPVTTAFYPRFVALVTQHDEASLAGVYHHGQQLLSVIIGSAAAVLMLFGDRVLLAWTRDPALVENAAPLLTVLALGTLLNVLMWIPYYLQLAYGWTRLAVQVNTVAVAVLVPALVIVVPIYGAISAAWVWVTLNAAYVVFVISLVHRRLLTAEKGRWYRRDVAMPLLPALATAAVCRLLAPAHLPRLLSLMMRRSRTSQT
jgi:O-antigen/teichoic acid export membrane protein